MSVGTAGLTKGLERARVEMKTFAAQSSGLKTALGALGGVVAVGKITGGLKSAIMAGSDLTEQLSASGVVFGDASSSVVAEADKMAASFGVPKAEFLEAASNIGSLGKAAGLAKPAAAALGIQFTKLGMDLSSFRNVPIEEALTAIRSGLSGEAEPLKRFGVLLNEAAVQGEAARMGLAAMGSELTEGQKVQARAAIISRQLGDAQGDLARTAGGAANMMRTIGGRTTNLAAELGIALQPITDMALRGVDGFAQWATSIVQWGLQGSGAVSGFVSVIQNLPAHWSIAQDQFQFGAMAIVQWMAVIPENLALIGEWIGTNFTALLADEWTKIGLGFSNLATNIKNIWTAVQTFLAGGKFEFNWIHLEEGFKASVAKLPDFVGPAASDAMVELEKQITAKQNALAQTVAAQQAAKAVATSPAAKEAEALADVQKKAAKEEKKFAGAVELGSKEARSSILAGRGLADGKDGLKDLSKTGKTHLAEARRQTVALEKIASNPAALAALPI